MSYSVLHKCTKLYTFVTLSGVISSKNPDHSIDNYTGVLTFYRATACNRMHSIAKVSLSACPSICQMPAL